MATGTGSLEELEYRMSLYRHLYKRAELLRAPLDARSLSTSRIRTELTARRIGIPPAADYNDDDELYRSVLIERLENAVLDDVEKAPVRIPFGIRHVSSNDFENIDSFELLLLVQHFGVDVDDIDLLEETFDRDVVQTLVQDHLEAEFASRLRIVISQHLQQYEDEHSVVNTDVSSSDSDDSSVESTAEDWVAMFLQLQNVLSKRLSL